MVRLDAFPLKLEIRQGCPCLPLQFNILLEVIANGIRPGKRTEAVKTGKEELKLSFLFLDSMIVLHRKSQRIKNQKTKHS